MESFWATLKSELIQDRVFASRAEAKSESFWYIEIFYNHTRLHSALGYTSPRGLREQPELNTHQLRTPPCPRFRRKIRLAF